MGGGLKQPLSWSPDPCVPSAETSRHQWGLGSGGFRTQGSGFGVRVQGI